MIQRLLFNILTEELTQSVSFYTTLFDMKIAYESDWFVQLTDDQGKYELGILSTSNDLIPEKYQHLPQGVSPTFVVESSDAVYELAKEKGYTVVASPEDTFYGQRRLLLEDPSGMLVDVSSLIANFDPSSM